MSRAVQLNIEQESIAVSPGFQILARRPVKLESKDVGPESPACGTDPLRETLPWPLPKEIQEQLADFSSIRETVAWEM